MRGGLTKSAHPEVYHTMRKNERISNILYKKVLEKTIDLQYFGSNIHRDGMKEKVAKTVVRIIVVHK